MISPAWCIGWFFVPVANLFMPYRVVRQIALAADPEGRGVAPGYVLAWWLPYIGSLVVSAVVRGTHPDLVSQLAGGLVYNLLATLALAALWAMMRFIRRGLDHWAAQPG